MGSERTAAGTDYVAHRRGALGLALVLASACATSDPGAREAPARDGGTAEVAEDGDGDGLCDATEWELGTLPDDPDSDGDGLPDLIELGNGFGPLEPAAPAADQLGDLVALSGAALDFAVRLTVQGDGRGVIGFFVDLPALYVDASSAADLFAGATAVSADPMDGPRSINAGAAEFTAVLGKTRLAFNVRFEYEPTADEAAEEPLSCIRAYPFRYAVKASDGEDLDDRLYLLRVVPEGDEAEYCLPADCH